MGFVMKYSDLNSDLDRLLKQLGTKVSYTLDDETHSFYGVVQIEDIDFDDSYGDGINQPRSKSLTILCTSTDAAKASEAEVISFTHDDENFVGGTFVIAEVARPGDGSALLVLEEEEE